MKSLRAIPKGDLVYSCEGISLWVDLIDLRGFTKQSPAKISYLSGTLD